MLRLTGSALLSELLDLIQQLYMFLPCEQHRRIDVILGEYKNKVPTIVNHPQFLIDHLQLLQHHQKFLHPLFRPQFLQIPILLHRHLKFHHLPVEVLINPLVEELRGERVTCMSRLMIFIVQSTALADSLR